LTPREYSLLEALARRPGEPITRSELLDQVWGADHGGDSNVVDVYVGYLRRKLCSETESGPPIETVRGIGYRMVAS
jgi:two-component system OmpR family response regulator